MATTVPSARARVPVALDDRARRSMRVIRRIIIIYAFSYNTVSVVLAMSGHITPLVEAIMLPVSSLTVVLGSWLGGTFTLESA